MIVTARNSEQVAHGLDTLEAAHVDGVNVLASPILYVWSPHKRAAEPSASPRKFINGRNKPRWVVSLPTDPAYSSAKDILSDLSIIYSLVPILKISRSSSLTIRFRRQSQDGEGNRLHGATFIARSPAVLISSEPHPMPDIRGSSHSSKKDRRGDAALEKDT
jgi:hypothetical protein